MTTALDVTPFLHADGEADARRGLSKVALGLVGSEILKVAAEIRAMQADGHDVVNLTVGDFAPSEFRIPEKLEREIGVALAAGQTNYPPSDGLLELRQAVKRFLAREQGLDYPLNGILIAGGARPLLYAAYRAVLDPGDEVVYPVPSWNNNHYAHLVGAKGVPVVCRAEEAFLPTPVALLPTLRTARMLVLNSPLNPTGTALSAQVLEAITRAVVAENERRAAAGERALFLLYDQVYWTLTAAGTTHVDPVRLVPESAPWVIFIDGISKAFAATGLRVGWSCAPPAVTARMRDLLGHVGAWAPRPEQRASAALLDDEAAVTGWLEHMRGAVGERLSVLYDGIRALQAAGAPVDAIAPSGAIYLSARFDLVGATWRGRRMTSNEEVRGFLLREAGLAVVPFQAFGYPHHDGWMRLSVGAVSVGQCRTSIERLGEALNRLG